MSKQKHTKATAFKPMLIKEKTLKTWPDVTNVTSFTKSADGLK